MKHIYFFVLGAILLLPVSLVAQRTVTVTGAGSVSSKPDHVILTMMITSQNNTAQTVFSQSDETSARLMKSLSDAGVSPEDISQRTFALNPTYDYSGNGGNSPKLVGYHLMTTYEVKVRNIRTLPVVLDAGSLAGANNMTIEGYDVTNREKMKDAAMKKAIEDARESAEKLAHEMGGSLGEILSVADAESAGVASPMAFGREEEEERRGPGRVNPQEIKKRVEVKVTFSVK
ncbi:MAG: SIMPL domain-containing protein [bacterium]